MFEVTFVAAFSPIRIDCGWIIRQMLYQKLQSISPFWVEAEALEGE